MELYTTRLKYKNTFLPAPKSIIENRIKCYKDNNIPIGISFELLFWEKIKNQ